MGNYLTCALICFLCVFLYSSIADDSNSNLPTVSTKNVTAHFCPHPCTVGNETLCYPPPCPLPPCVDPARYKPTDCCQFCPNGANCRGPAGTIIPWNHWKIVGGKNCTCKYIAQDAVCV